MTVVVHDSIVISDESKAAFEEASGLALEVVSAGDGGALANQLVLTKDSPLGDVAYGIDNSFASRAVSEGVFAPYTSPVQPELSAQLALALPGEHLVEDRLTLADIAVAITWQGLSPAWPI